MENDAMDSGRVSIRDWKDREENDAISPCAPGRGVLGVVIGVSNADDGKEDESSVPGQLAKLFVGIGVKV